MNRLSAAERRRAFYQFYENEHWRTCQEDDCPTCEIFERFHPVKRKELRKIKEVETNE